MRSLIYAVLLGLTCHLLLPAPTAAQSLTEAVEAGAPLEDASRLTWDMRTRASGIAALRSLASAEPDNADARLELGRVLTWDASTRTEGVALLRQVVTMAPERSDVVEALATVLSWDGRSRDEAIRHLRGLLEREPARTSARLTLAEVLSWNPETREESRTLYLRVLEEDERSVRAAVGLARVLSWSGRLAESRAWYQVALARNPGDQAAQAGLLELDGWSGKARASLRSLATLPDGTIETSDAIRLRAQAYSQIGRPAEALSHYDKLLVMNPADQRALEAARDLRRRLRPVLEIGMEGSRESGDPATSRVDTSWVPLRFSFHPGQGDAEVSLLANLASYSNAIGASRDGSAGVSVTMPAGDRTRISAEMVAHEIDRAGRTFTGRGQFQIAPHDRFDITFGLGREQLSSSRLSLAGEQAADAFYGPSFVNQAVVGASVRPARDWDVWAQATKGEIRGANIASNRREELYAGIGRTFHAGAATVRPGYTLAWMSYDLDLDGFPATDAGGDGVTSRGIGGYFSPRLFVNHMARFDATFPVGSLVLMGGAGVGRQRVDELPYRDFGHSMTSSDAYLGVRVNASERVSLSGQVSYQDVASAFDRTAVRVGMTYGF